SGDVDNRETFWEIAVPRRYLLGFALYDYWGRATHIALAPDFTQVRAMYAGALPLALGAAALIVRPTAMRIGVAAFGALMLAVVLGVWPLPELSSYLPIVKTTLHIRLTIVVMLCLALLAGWGLDDLTAEHVPRRNVLLAVAGA
ncbi:hypothetical protein D7X96_39305, partial [Corallococcus interemptor]